MARSLAHIAEKVVKSEGLVVCLKYKALCMDKEIGEFLARSSKSKYLIDLRVTTFDVG